MTRNGLSRRQEGTEALVSHYTEHTFILRETWKIILYSPTAPTACCLKKRLSCPSHITHTGMKPNFFHQPDEIKQSS
jgi:hypothetical protein